MKIRKVMKKKKVSKLARGRMAKALVFRGSKEKTVGGLTRDSLMKNKRGKIVSKRNNAKGKRAFKNVETWHEAFMQAREMLRVEGFPRDQWEDAARQGLVLQDEGP